MINIAQLSDKDHDINTSKQTTENVSIHYKIYSIQLALTTALVHKNIHWSVLGCKNYHWTLFYVLMYLVVSTYAPVHFLIPGIHSDFP